MPTLMLHVRADAPVVLPLASQRAIQGMLYHALAINPALAHAVHNTGGSFEAHTFRFFTFSRLRAAHHVQGRNAVYTGAGRIEIRTADPLLAEALADGLLCQGHIELLHQRLAVTGLQVFDTVISWNDVEIRMITPLTAHVRGENGFIRFFSPDEPDFYQLLAVNYRRKASAFFGREATDSISVAPIEVLPKHRCITSFKGTSICGYYGRYRLCGTPEALTFLYHTGIGPRNSQGFGLFDVMDSAGITRVAATSGTSFSAPSSL